MFDHFFEKGWMILDFSDPNPIFRAKELLEGKLTELFGKHCPLEEYDLQDDHKHTEIQVQLTEYYRKLSLGPQIIASELSFFQRFLGPDLFAQANPYLRITRPNKPQDNIGYHRDTFYGGSPFELSVLVPFVDVDHGSALKVISGSHVQADSLYPTNQVKDMQVEKGSLKHKLGFLYAPKLMDDLVEAKMEPIPLKLGQALIFGLSCVHGSRINSGQRSRWSSDIRVMNAFAPVDLSSRPDYYQTLSESVLTQAAKTYERRNHVELELCDPASRKSTSAQT